MSSQLTADLERRFEYAKAFLNRAESATADDERKTMAETAVVLAFSFLEGTLTHVFDHFSESRHFDMFEKSVMAEKDIKLISGEPCLTDTKYRSIEDRIQFLIWRFSGAPFDKNLDWWPGFCHAIKKRNSLMHPKGAADLSAKDARQCLSAIIEATNHLMIVVFGKPWPRAKKGLVASFEI